MEDNNQSCKNIDEYISQFTPEIQEILKQIRQVVMEAAPGAEERISYQMPAFFQNGILVYFAAFKKHIGFFPTADGVEAFKNELSGYKCSKGTIQLPLDKPLPFGLINRIVKYRVEQNKKQAEEKSKKQ